MFFPRVVASKGNVITPLKSWIDGAFSKLKPG